LDFKKGKGSKKARILEIVISENRPGFRGMEVVRRLAFGVRRLAFDELTLNPKR